MAARATKIESTKKAYAVRELPPIIGERIVIKTKLVILDASNIARYQTKDINRIPTVANALRSKNVKFIFVFDANFSHIFGYGVDISKMSEDLGLEAHETSVVPSGSQADDFILQMGLRDGSLIVSNDLYRDRPIQMQKIADKGALAKFLIVGNSILVPDLELDAQIR